MGARAESRPELELARLRAMFEHSFEFMALLSVEGVVLELNRGALVFAGGEREQVVGRPFTSAPWWREGAEADQEWLRRALLEVARGRFVRCELEVLAASGREAVLDLALTPVVEEGRVTFLLAEGRDVTERKRAEQTVQTSEAMLAGIIRIAADAIISVNEEQRITLFNEGAERIFGYTRAEVLGKPVGRLLPERFRAAHREHLRAFGQGPRRDQRMNEHREILGRRKNGEEFPAEATITRLGPHERRVYTVALRDITERKRIEEEQRFLARAGELLARSLDFEATLAQVAELMVPRLADCCLIHLQGPGEEIELAAVSHADEEKGRLLRELLRQYPVRVDAPQGVGRVIRTGEPLVFSELSERVHQEVARDAEHLSLLKALGLTSALAVPLRGRERVLGALALGMSGSRRHVGERELAFAEELARLAALALENAKLYREARSATRARDEVLGIVAHDLRSPLGALFMSAQRIERHLERGQTGPETQEAVGLVLRLASRMGRLVEDLLDISRLEAGRLSITPRPVAVGRLVAEAVEQARPTAVGLELGLDVAESLPELQGDRDRLLQVLSNLVGNAVKFTPEGGRITVGARLEPEGKALRLWVEDTGPGIPEEHRAHLFDRFWQARRDDRRGAGLGLAICKHLVEAHGGRLGVESEVGRGSTFWLVLPLAPAPASPLSSGSPRSR